MHIKCLLPYILVLKPICIQYTVGVGETASRLYHEISRNFQGKAVFMRIQKKKQNEPRDCGSQAAARINMKKIKGIFLSSFLMSSLMMD